jgi:hypothetical protein
MATIDLLPTGQSYRKPKASVGHHGDNSAFVFDEASGIEHGFDGTARNSCLMTDAVAEPARDVDVECKASAASSGDDLRVATAEAARMKGTKICMYMLLLTYALLINVPFWVLTITVFDPRYVPVSCSAPHNLHLYHLRLCKASSKPRCCLFPRFRIVTTGTMSLVQEEC